MIVLRLLLGCRWRQSLATSAAVAALIGGIGSFILGSATSARRVESSYRNLIDEIDAPDLLVQPACAETSLPLQCITRSDVMTDDTALAGLRALDVVQQARVVRGLRPFLVNSDGAPLLATSIDPSGCRQSYTKAIALVTGGPRDQAVPFRLDGRLPTSGSSGVVLARSAAERASLAIGDTLHVGGICDPYSNVQRFGSPIDLVITGLSVGPLDVELPGAGGTVDLAYVEPAVFEALQIRGAEPEIEMSVWLKPTAATTSASAALSQFEILTDFRQHATAVDEALALDARMLWLLAAIGVVGGILVLWPIVSRNIRESGTATVTLSALGATPRQIAVQAAAHGTTLGLIGALVATIVAVPASAVMPLGLAAAVLPNGQASIDWTVTICGAALMAAGVSLLGAIPSWRMSTTGVTKRRTVPVSAGVSLRSLRVAPASRTGVLAAIGTPAGRHRSHQWASLVPLILFATVGVGSMTYIASVRYVERTPSAVGWNWSALVSVDEADESQVQAAISHIVETEGVEQVTSTLAFPPYFLTAPDTGASFVWPWAFATGPDAIRPTMLTGRPPEGPDEVAVDSVFAKQTGVRVGDVIRLGRPALALQIRDDLRFGAQELGIETPQFEAIGEGPAAHEFEVTGIAVLPLERSVSIPQAAFTLDGFRSLAPDEGEIAALWAWLPDDLDEELRNRVEYAIAAFGRAPGAVYVRYSGDSASVSAALWEIDGVTNVLAPEPAEVWRQIGLNLDRTDRIPHSLAVMVAGLFFALIAFSLSAAVKARRFEFAVMRALGMSTTGICRSVAVQATATAVVALAVAIPCGVGVGRAAWLSYARDLAVAQVPVIPWTATALAGVAAVAVANLAALSLGWPSIRRTPATDLRLE